MENIFNAVALRTAKTLWSFCCTERNRVKIKNLLVELTPFEKGDNKKKREREKKK